ncbi:MAG: YicC/YloC family endoribonuclease [Pseudomonadota bacterium]
MPASMTGFGRGMVQAGRLRFVVEVRSVNNRFCEVRFQAPKDFLELEHILAARIRGEFDRGKFDVVLKVEPKGAGASEIDEAQVVKRWKRLDRIRKKLGIPQPVRLETALNNNSQSEGAFKEEEARKILLKAADQALARLKTFRIKEGEALGKDVRRRVRIMQEAVEDVAQKAAQTAGIRLAKLRERVSQLLNGKPVDSSRLEVELALLADKADVTEELVRLREHLRTLMDLVGSRKASGRQIDFLLQEIHREVNTIGSKATDIGVTETVVLMKAEAEKIREQAQNLE